MATLIGRNQSRTSILRVIDFIDDDEFHNKNEIQLKNQLDYLMEQWIIFSDNNNQLRAMAIDDADEEQQHAQLFNELEPMYLEAKSTLEVRYNQLMYGNAMMHDNDQQNMQQFQNQQQPQQIVVKIDQPKREVENTWGEFNGNFTKWRGFCDLFTDRVHNDNALSNAHKFRLLKSSLKGTAAAALGDWELSDDNYLEAWNRLKELYEQTYLTGKQLIYRLNALPRLEKATGNGIQKLSNIGNEVFRQLRALQYPVDNLDFIFIFIMHEKLDDETGIKWNLDRNNDFPTLPEFTLFLDRQARALATVNYDKQKSSTSKEGQKRTKVSDRAKFEAKKSKFEATETKTQGPPVCILCKASHALFRCAEFAKMPLTKRKQYVKNNNLCHNCLKVGHVSKDCTLNECFRCNQKHNSLLCHEDPKNKQTATSSASGATVTRSAKKKVVKSKQSDVDSNSTSQTDEQ